MSVHLAGTPTLRTDRLVLRAPLTADFEGYAAFAASDRAAYTGGPMTREMAWRSFCHLTGHWVHRGYGPFVLDQHGRGIGTIGPYCPEGWPEPEIAWTLWRSEGTGIALEAARAARGYAYGVLGWTTAISMIDPENARSVALAHRMGCVPDGTFQHERIGLCHIWRHPGPEARV